MASVPFALPSYSGSCAGLLDPPCARLLGTISELSQAPGGWVGLVTVRHRLEMPMVELEAHLGHLRASGLVLVRFEKEAWRASRYALVRMLGREVSIPPREPHATVVSADRRDRRLVRPVEVG